MRTACWLEKVPHCFRGLVWLPRSAIPKHSTSYTVKRGLRPETWMFMQKGSHRSEFIRGWLVYRHHECLHMHIRTSILKATALALEQGQPSFETDTSSTNFTSNEHLPPNFSCEPFDQIASLTQGSLGQGYLPSFQLNDSPLITNGRDTFYATSPTPNTPNTTVYHLQFRHCTLSMTCSTDLAVYHLVRLTTTDGLIQATVPAPFLAQKKTFKTSGPMLQSTRNT